MAMLPENCPHVIVVAHCLQIEQQGRKALDPQSSGSEQRDFHTMRQTIWQHPEG
jgi:hypothetical protein